MVENRKYLQHEIQYVLSRILANWKPETIAQAFKRDHAPYWNDRLFTKKQVSYIRNTYKGPPGSVQPYNGPIPEFTPSPLPHTDREDSRRLLRMNPNEMDMGSTVSRQFQDPMVGPPIMMGPTAQAQQLEGALETQHAPAPPAALGDDLDDAAFNEFFDFEAYYGTAPAADSGVLTGLDQPSIPGEHITQTGSTNGTADGVDGSGLIGDTALGLNEHGGDAAHDRAQDPVGVEHPVRALEVPLSSVEEHDEASVRRSNGHDDSYGSNSKRDSGPAHQFKTCTNNFTHNPGNISKVARVQQPGSAGGQFPPGCSSQNAGGHFSDGCEYQGAHDTCIIPTAHRHHWDGAISFRNYQACVEATALMYPDLTNANELFQGLEAYPLAGLEEQDQTMLASIVSQPTRLSHPQQNMVNSLPATDHRVPDVHTPGFTDSEQPSTELPNNLYGPVVDGGLELMNSLLNTPVMPFSNQNVPLYANNQQWQQRTSLGPPGGRAANIPEFPSRISGSEINQMPDTFVVLNNHQNRCEAQGRNPRGSSNPKTGIRNDTMAAPQQTNNLTNASTPVSPEVGNDAEPQWDLNAICKVYGVSNIVLTDPYGNHLGLLQQRIPCQQNMTGQSAHQHNAHQQVVPEQIASLHNSHQQIAFPQNSHHKNTDHQNSHYQSAHQQVLHQQTTPTHNFHQQTALPQHTHQQNARPNTTHGSSAHPGAARGGRARPQSGRGNTGRQKIPENAGQFNSHINGIQKKVVKYKKRSLDDDDYDPFKPAL